MQVPYCLRVGEAARSSGFDGRRRVPSPFRSSVSATGGRRPPAEMSVPSHIRATGEGRFEEMVGGSVPPELQYEQRQKKRREMVNPNTMLTSVSRSYADDTYSEFSSDMSSIVSEVYDDPIDVDSASSSPLSSSSSSDHSTSVSDSRTERVSTPRPVGRRSLRRRGSNLRRHKSASPPRAGWPGLTGLFNWENWQRKSREMSTSEMVFYSMGASYVMLKLVSWLVRRMVG